MAYVAKKRLKVGIGTKGVTTFREYGAVVPEVENWDWKTREAYIRGGYIEYRPDVAAKDE